MWSMIYPSIRKMYSYSIYMPDTEQSFKPDVHFQEHLIEY